MPGKALTILAFIVIFGAALGVFFLRDAPTAQDEEAAARSVVTEFGTKLKNVSLLADGAIVADAIQREYGPYVDAALLTEWRNDPSLAPGRETSSPWPERIETTRVQYEAGPRYVFEGYIIEVTNEGGGIGESATEASRRPITVAVERRDGLWKITMLKLGANPSDGDWTYSEVNAQGMQFKYPKTLPTTFITAATPEGWPPTVTLEGGDYSCAENEERMIGDREYCVVETSEGAAGSTYRTLEYITAQGDFIARVKFTLRFPQCANYPEPQKSACESEQRSFDIDGLADRIASSIRMH